MGDINIPAEGKKKPGIVSLYFYIYVEQFNYAFNNLIKLNESNPNYFIN